MVAGTCGLGGLRGIHVFDVVTSGFNRSRLVRWPELARKPRGKPRGLSLLDRVRRQALNRISAFEGFWRRRAGDLLKKVWLGLTTLVEGVTEDTDEEMFLVVVYAGAKTAWEVEDVLER